VRRRTSTPGLVCDGPRGVFYLVHAPSGERLHPESMRTRRDVLAVGEALGTLDVDWTLSKAQIITAADARVPGGFRAVLEYLRVTASKSWARVGTPPASPPDLPRLIAAQCHYCRGDGRGTGGYGPDGDQCGRCFDAYPVLRRRGWCMTSSSVIPHLHRSTWRELTPAQRRKWDAIQRGDAVTGSTPRPTSRGVVAHFGGSR
jgi:hypothetical protein